MKVQQRFFFYLLACSSLTLLCMFTFWKGVTSGKPACNGGASTREMTSKPTKIQGNSQKTEVSKPCSRYLDLYVQAVKPQNCSILVEYLYGCLNYSDRGREPLPNFFLTRNKTSADALSDYRQANVAFVHLPKVGGTSVERVLSKIPAIRKRRVSHCSYLYQQAIDFRKNKNQTLFYSKRTFGLHKFAYPHRPFAYVTWFREPIARMISTYFYVKKKKCAGVHKVCIQYIVKSKNLTDYLLKTQDVHFQDMDNFYIRLLQFGDFPEIDTTFEDGVGGVDLKDAKMIPKIEEKHYLVARNNFLTKMAFVGLTEDFKTSEDMLSFIFGIPASTSATHVNANPHNNNITEYELEELTRRNIWDLKLYEEAKQIYYQQKEKYLWMRRKFRKT